MDIKEALGKPFLKRAIDWMDTYVACRGRGLVAPAWVSDLPHRNMPATATASSR
jgi:hypothetical protein